MPISYSQLKYFYDDFNSPFLQLHENKAIQKFVFMKPVDIVNILKIICVLVFLFWLSL